MVLETYASVIDKAPSASRCQHLDDCALYRPSALTATEKNGVRETIEEKEHLVSSLQDFTLQSNKQHLLFEGQHSFSAIVRAVDALPSGLVTGAIKCYQGVIRENQWYFPTLSGIELSAFLDRWKQVHMAYFATAEEIFSLHIQTSRGNLLSNPALLTKVVQSETMRGWVGKRSPSGLDALVDARTAKIESLLPGMDPGIIDDIMYIGGVYAEDTRLLTAERELIDLFALYHRTVGCDLNIAILEDADVASGGIVKRLLREFCRYSVIEFNENYHALCLLRERLHHFTFTNEAAHEEVHRLLSGVPTDLSQRVKILLSELRILNHLNLNLEVKHGFKAWAGLMHLLVFVACSEAVNISNDIYHTRSSLQNLRMIKQ